MICKHTAHWMVVTLIALRPAACLAVTVVATQGGGPTPQQLAEIIADPASSYTVVAGSATTLINNGGSTLSSSRSMGSFANGLTAFGTPLPPDNDGSPAATYAGGLDIASGVCLCTGAVTDADASDPGLTGRGVGIEGPNNGYRIATMAMHEGEIGQQFHSDGTIDADFDRAVFNSQMTTNPLLVNSSDPVVLQFEIQLTSPGYLRVSTVFGADEYDAYIEQEYNDSFAILVKNDCTAYENIALLNKFGVLEPFTLQAVRACGPPTFKENQVAPEPAVLPPSVHAIDKNGDNVGDAADGVPHYDHEFGGFTAVRTWETKCPLPPGTYIVKFVIHDVADGKVDAGLFIREHSLKLYAFLPADFNLDGSVTGADYSILAANFGECGKKFIEGDANGDCCVTGADYSILSASFGQTGGNRDLKFDYDRDNGVGGNDLLTWQRWSGMTQCASRFEGDSDKDGDVDSADQPPGDSTQLAGPCGGGGGSQSLAGDNGSEELSDAGTPVSIESADLDHDGDVDRDDVDLFGEMVAGQ